jgi:hypothetical protein
MLEPDEKNQLTGLARSIDKLFALSSDADQGVEGGEDSAVAERPIGGTTTAWIASSQSDGLDTPWLPSRLDTEHPAVAIESEETEPEPLELAESWLRHAAGEAAERGEVEPEPPMVDVDLAQAAAMNGESTPPPLAPEGVVAARPDPTELPEEWLVSMDEPADEPATASPEGTELAPEASTEPTSPGSDTAPPEVEAPTRDADAPTADVAAPTPDGEATTPEVEASMPAVVESTPEADARTPEVEAQVSEVEPAAPEADAPTSVVAAPASEAEAHSPEPEAEGHLPEPEAAPLPFAALEDEPEAATTAVEEVEAPSLPSESAGVGHEPAVEETAFDVVSPSGAGDEAAPAEDEVEFVPTALDLAVDAYLEGDQHQVAEIARLGHEMLDARDIDPIVRAVVRVMLAAGEPPERSVSAVVEPLLVPSVLTGLARRIGRERVEERRHEFHQVSRAIGPAMARAVRDDLAETTDRLARRLLCETLVEMGPAARETIEEMAGDENRFLARNAIVILGDVGGERAVELATEALASPDARIRREALRSLTKLGDTSSGPLVVGLLEDSDDEVRSAAAVAAGELKVERALKPIMTMLDETRDMDRALPLIRALGHLGDPGAVASIERYAVKSLFSRPPADVRVAAYRALHQIGTPHARKLLNRAIDDRDPKVKSAVKSILNLR